VKRVKGGKSALLSQSLRHRRRSRLGVDLRKDDPPPAILLSSNECEREGREHGRRPQQDRLEGKERREHQRERRWIGEGRWPCEMEEKGIDLAGGVGKLLALAGLRRMSGCARERNGSVTGSGVRRMDGSQLFYTLHRISGPGDY